MNLSATSAVAVVVNGVLLAALAAAVLLLSGLQPLDSARGVPPVERVAWAAAASAIWLGLVWRGWQRARGLRLRSVPASVDVAATHMLVVHASQTGYAEQLAWQTATSLRDAGVPAQVAALGALDTATLRAASRLLLVASTTGEGDAPDAALAFMRDVMPLQPSLTQTRYGVLALGDRNYANFCAFGRNLDQWLRRQGAEAWFDRIDVDNGDAEALRRWQWQLGRLAGTGDMPEWQAPCYRPWRLVERRLLNADCHGHACFSLRLCAADAEDADWEAGDIAEIGPRHAPAQVEAFLQQTGFRGTQEVATERGSETLAMVLVRSILPDPAMSVGLDVHSFVANLEPLPHREYSIASLPGDGAIDLLVRRMDWPDGRLGLGSGWLTRHAEIGSSIDLRIRRNPGFRAPADAQGLILVGNGTGIAGLRALLKARILAGNNDNWLLFGERHGTHDFHYGDDFGRWLAEGWLRRMDLAFSREGTERDYVQDRLRAAAGELRAWIAEGASIRVCGSQQGMARDVHATLVDILGETVVETLLADGRYRRDVY